MFESLQTAGFNIEVKTQNVAQICDEGFETTVVGSWWNGLPLNFSRYTLGHFVTYAFRGYILFLPKE